LKQTSLPASINRLDSTVHSELLFSDIKSCPVELRMIRRTDQLIFRSQISGPPWRHSVALGLLCKFVQNESTTQNMASDISI